ncbi:MAG: AAA domain-containing protein [Acidimicrobiales bacterium]
MDPAVTDCTARIVRALDDLSRRGAGEVHHHIPLDRFRWLPASAARLFAPTTGTPAVHEIDWSTARRLATVDLVRMGPRTLRVGWLFVAGTFRGRSWFTPLVSVPVRAGVPPLRGAGLLTVAGDTELTPLVPDPADRVGFEARVPWGDGSLDPIRTVEIPPAVLAGLGPVTTFARSVTEACRLPVAEVTAATASADTYGSSPHRRIVAGVAVYAVADDPPGSHLDPPGRAAPWADTRSAGGTAFHTLYQGHPAAPALAPADGAGLDRVSPLPLSGRQRDAVSAGRAHPLLVVSGAPGTGTSHTLAAIALDAIARGESVLVTAGTEAALDIMIDLLGAADGPVPVVFGSSEHRIRSSEDRSARSASAAGPRRLGALDQAYRDAAGRVERARATIGDRLRALRLDPTVTARHQAAAPGLFAAGADLDATTVALRAVDRAGGWVQFRHRRRRRLLRRIGAASDTSAGELLEIVATAATVRAAEGLTPDGTTVTTTQWAELVAAEDDRRNLTGAWLRAGGPGGRPTRRVQARVDRLIEGLRSGRAERRRALSGVDRALLAAVPLWVGSPRDVDELLPPVPALFDLVIVDNAAALDQAEPAGSLLRGRRAVVGGDPRRLRPVPHNTADGVAATLARHGLSDDRHLHRLVNARTNSLLDAAGRAAPIVRLDEQVRSLAHVTERAAAALGDGTVAVATRAPSNHDFDAVTTVRLNANRDADGVVRAEVDWVVGRLRVLRPLGVGRVGVISPFRAQADAIEAAVLDRFSPADIEALGLRVGTVHAAQDHAHDLVLISLGVGSDDGADTWGLVDEARMFSAMTTRARARIVLVCSATPPAGSRVARYLAVDDRVPPVPASTPVGPWASRVAERLRGDGLEVITGYPVGRHRLDVCLPGLGDVAVECALHPLGVEAHIERRLLLERAGWRVIEAHEARWGDRLDGLARRIVSPAPAAGGWS